LCEGVLEYLRRGNSGIWEDEAKTQTQGDKLGRKKGRQGFHWGGALLMKGNSIPFVAILNRNGGLVGEKESSDHGGCKRVSKEKRLLPEIERNGSV